MDYEISPPLGKALLEAFACFDAFTGGISDEIGQMVPDDFDPHEQYHIMHTYVASLSQMERDMIPASLVALINIMSHTAAMMITGFLAEMEAPQALDTVMSPKDFLDTIRHGVFRSLQNEESV